MFRIDRTFSQRNEKTGRMEWFFNAREGTYGPYYTEKDASTALKRYIQYQKSIKNDGGRSEQADATGKEKLTVLPLEFTQVTKQFDPKHNDPLRRNRSSKES